MLIYVESAEAQKNLQLFFYNNLINEKRIIFFPRLKKIEYYNLMQEVDVLLDSFPYNGGTTTNDALKMGLPIITMYGETISSRMGASILKYYQLDELIAYSAVEYENKAVELALNKQKYNFIKNKVIEKIKKKNNNGINQYVEEFENMLKSKVFEKNECS